ncbi:hypothetical protein D0Y65_034237 [Glycine soja]|uniref:Uncharacterized protein n=1 Tax=Glycine soja TaxID=3848 RepID=A0A445HPH6_GLYSO|nr:hypothetical protein D0Y65_034237 [Glycine soja]
MNLNPIVPKNPESQRSPQHHRNLLLIFQEALKWSSMDTKFRSRPYRSQECTQGFLLSGSGDFTVSNSFNIPVYFLYESLLDESNVDCFSHVRLWNTDSGALLDTCEVAIKAGLLEANGKAEERGHAVTDLCAVLDGLLVAVPIQSLQGIVLLSCSVSAQTLSVAKKKVAMVMKKASANGHDIGFAGTVHFPLYLGFLHLWKSLIMIKREAMYLDSIDNEQCEFSIM